MKSGIARSKKATKLFIIPDAAKTFTDEDSNTSIQGICKKDVVVDGVTEDKSIFKGKRYFGDDEIAEGRQHLDGQISILNVL